MWRNSLFALAIIAAAPTGLAAKAEAAPVNAAAIDAIATRNSDVQAVGYYGYAYYPRHYGYHRSYYYPRYDYDCGY